MLMHKVSIGAGIQSIIATSPIESSPIDTMKIQKNLDENHQDAIDLFTGEGLPVRSVTSGIVVLAENNWDSINDLSTSSSYGGNVVIIFNPEEGNFYRYAHLQKSMVEPGKALQGGKIIGVVGSTGTNASLPGHGEHVHLEINKYDRTRGVMVAVSTVGLRERLEKFIKKRTPKR